MTDREWQQIGQTRMSKQNRTSFIPNTPIKLGLAIALCGWLGTAGLSNFAAAGSSATPPATSATRAVISGLQFQSLGTATRIIIPWSAPPSELKVDDSSGKPLLVSFPGRLTSITTSGAFATQKTFAYPNLHSVAAQNSKDGRLLLSINRTQKGSTVVRAGMHRMIIDIPHDYDRLSGAVPLSNGVRHFSMISKTSGGPVHVHVLEIDPKNPEIDIEPALAVNRMGRKATVGQIVSSHQALAGVNGSFFKPDTGMPLGLLMINQELISGPIYNRVALGIGADNSLQMAQIHLVGDVTATDRNGRLIRIPLSNVNQPRVHDPEYVVYTRRWGTTAPKVPLKGMQIQIIDNHVTGVSNTSPLAIPLNGMVVSGPITQNMVALSEMRSSQPLHVGVYTVPDWSNMKQAISGGPWLIKNSQPYIDVTAQHFSTRSLGTREPRTAAGITKTGRLLLVTVDGRHPKVSVGMTLRELSSLMGQLGAVNAMNLDGGSSTQMAIGAQVVNTPSSGKVGVSNSLVVKRSASGNVAASGLRSTY